jgi:hypothetical protein
MAVTSTRKKKKRLSVDLPKEIRHLKECDEDLDKFVIEVDFLSPVLVSIIYFNDDGKPALFDLSMLSVDHHRRLAYNMGIRSSGADTKSQCCTALGKKILEEYRRKESHRRR